VRSSFGLGAMLDTKYFGP